MVKLANKKFTSIKNDYCLTLDKLAIVKETKDDEQAIGKLGFSFTNLTEIEQIVTSCTVDVIGVVMEVNQTAQINLKDGNVRDKKTLLISDESYKSISLTLWGDSCHAHNYQSGQIIAFKNCRVSDFLGKSLSSSSNPKDCIVDPNHRRWIELKKFIGESKLTDGSPEIQAIS